MSETVRISTLEGDAGFFAYCARPEGEPRAAIVVILKNYVSAYIERWNMLLGFVFVLIVVFMPDGLVPGVRRWWAAWKARRS